MASDSPDRNLPCPCGSGIEYKRCHGSIVDPATSPGNIPINATAAKLGLARFPGQLQQLHIMNQFPSEDPRSLVPPGGAPEMRQVVFVLKRPGFPLVGERQLVFKWIVGDSHLAICQPTFCLAAQTSIGY